jgi:D-alanine-D-alanine ligase-like ATP-grasp enzyme
MKKKRTDPLLGYLFKKIATRIGARVTLEPEWKIAGQIAYKSGRKRYFRYTSIDMNTLGASEIAKDKDYAAFFMAKLGYPTIRGRAFFSDYWAEAIGSNLNTDAAYTYALKLGFPVIVKPNSASQGRGVSLVHSKAEFYRAMKHIFEIDRIALVQVPIKGRDYRVVVLDDEVISAYERIPLSVVGDGRSTIAQLLRKKQKGFIRDERDTVLKSEDPRITAKLKKGKMTMKSVLPKWTQVYLLDNANLSTGGDAVDVTDTMHQEFRDIAVRLTRDMGLRLCGVDIMVAGDIAGPARKSTYWIIEINAAPGLDHYATTGAAQRRIVEDLYLKVIKHMEQ